MGKNIQEVYTCAHCDSQVPKWQGKCPECGKWGSLEKSVTSLDKKDELMMPPAKVVSFDDIKIENYEKIDTKINEFNRVLGGGIVEGSLILLGGEPGIGKSTIVLEISQNIPGEVLYVSGEESASQIKSRIDRLEIKTNNLKFVGETSIETIIATISNQKPKMVIIDSIQTVYSQESPSGAGSVSQVRVCTTKLLSIAKKNNITILIIGHVTKFGEVAGPKTLEHLVDVVLYLEGNQFNAFRVLRGVKNRFGSTLEVGIFEMKKQGLVEVKDPASIFLSEKKDIAGSIIAPVLEGSRVFMLEVQALVNPTNFGYPQRKAVGFDLNRLQLLIATMSKRLDVKLDTQDVYLNLAGGLKTTEPAIDLAICLAIYSSLKNISITNDTVAFGEVGLGGEVRAVNQLDKRLKEAEKLGFKNIIVPHSKETPVSKKAKVIQVKTLAEAIKHIG